jgi:L-fuconolactonase
MGSYFGFTLRGVVMHTGAFAIGIELGSDPERLHLTMLTRLRTTFSKLCLMMARSPLAAYASSSSTAAPPPETADGTIEAAAPLGG